MRQNDFFFKKKNFFFFFLLMTGWEGWGATFYVNGSLLFLLLLHHIPFCFLFYFLPTYAHPHQRPR